MKKIHSKVMIALWIVLFGFVAGAADARLGYDYRDNLMFYGRPVETDIDAKVVTWENNGFTTVVKFSEKTGKAVEVESSSRDWSDKAFEQWLKLNTRTFGKDGEVLFKIFNIAPPNGDKEHTYQALFIYAKDGVTQVGAGLIKRRVFSKAAVLAITDLRD